ncbi:hypothetical protein GOP47_0021551 [Adiantum capillus-veneris]|uniref:Uncharacterized protein n=1 Tax=Adiantum capillus-veneris TaxID=13818 RepID=A0A9D4U7M2_ADICA|nr:hypothetical protein GOP47_0021551 [Adiantum capillus-veneris]
MRSPSSCRHHQIDHSEHGFMSLFGYYGQQVKFSNLKLTVCPTLGTEDALSLTVKEQSSAGIQIWPVGVDS